MKVKGYNDFYDGWISNILFQPRDNAKSNFWMEGYDMASETGRTQFLFEALKKEIELGHIIIEQE
ncbi:hypothetical protein VF04_04380 [Nostoc linckia z7]|uniref:Uncharacterized protein n=2 Tax=Nostoc linckia TaxID=92942 RepID=A0A9Q6EN69_NOSLI|nr:hypothetical protein [Nostoc linckia]PHK42949.1 hypothetical protein VF12_01080 [Nostoc linckia z15]PHK48106.1 hypothetical protein VF13_02055 [Nostoc linckia z16]PHJ65026.1 hypothetical protein VF02_11865 [Nostoc linckia z1]PHJ70067.1 hypothetical protein VF05_11260 [Nostoc linckia z3]PHJ75105.1 hypothetical protein VF03_12185 [Nostoc linckia z2]